MLSHVKIFPQEFHTNISGKVRNTKLPKSKALWPLFEVISNSIHAIEEKRNLNQGIIEISIERNGNLETLKELNAVETYPIKSFIIKDNGIGFNERNYTSFLTAESDYKIEKGAKGIGRFVCLKAFKTLLFNSFYKGEDGTIHRRSFELKPIGKGVFDQIDEVTNVKTTGTTITLNRYHEEYQANCPKHLKEIAEKIIEHFLVYFLLNKCPYIRIIDSNNTELLLQDIYGSSFKQLIDSKEFRLRSEVFNLHLLKMYEISKGHKIHYCANEREVIEENLIKLLPDLGKSIKDNEGQRFTYQVYVTSEFLDKHVETERTGFDFPSGENVDDGETPLDTSIITFRLLQSEVIIELEDILKDYLDKVRNEKLEDYKNHIYDDAPQFKPILKYRPEAIKRMQPGLKGNKLNIELFKIQNELELETKELGEEILNGKNDIRSTEEYLKKYDEFIEKFNDLGKATLAQYIVHRKAVIELLDKFISFDTEEEGFKTEDTIHKIFFPIKSISDEVSYEQQNLWLIDERLAYHLYLSSDKSLKEVEVIDGIDSDDRTDLLIFNSSFAFVNDDAPHNSFVIVEFKRPERSNYSTSDPKKNPIDQVITYIRKIRDNKAIDRRGKYIQIDKDRTPFYAYIICDINPKLLEIISERDYKKTPDGMGYFYFHKEYNAYIELISYMKLLKDARMRNRILFDKLGLPY